MEAVALTAVIVVIALTMAWGLLGVLRANEGRGVERELRRGAEREPVRRLARRSSSQDWSVPRAA